MELIEDLMPEIGMMPSEFAWKAAQAAAAAKSPLEKRRLGQYFTPPEAGRLMIQHALFNPTDDDTIHVLEPGAGTAFLACLLTEALAQHYPGKTLHLTCYEIDTGVLPLARKVLTCLQEYINTRTECRLHYTLHETDFISRHTHLLTGKHHSIADAGQYHYIISNPPFFKIPPGTKHYPLAASMCNGQPNMYLLFMAIAKELLCTGGQMLILVPRSICGGGQFAAFRRTLLQRMELNSLHLFTAGTVLFGSDCLAYEQVIFSAVKTTQTKQHYPVHYTCSAAPGGTELHTTLHYTPKENLLPLPQDDRELAMLQEFCPPVTKLKSLKLSLLPGSLLKSEAEAFLLHTPNARGQDAARVIWYNGKNGRVSELNGTPEKYPRYIQVRPETRVYLLPAGNYVLRRRYSTGKADGLVTAQAYIHAPGDGAYIALDKKLFVLRKRQGTLSEAEAHAITAQLNSSELNRCLHMLYGSINLGISELQELLGEVSSIPVC